MIKTFNMIRRNDESGVSGTGQVAQGAVFDNGATVLVWTVAGMPNSIEIWKNYDEFLEIHVKSHPTNKTRIEFNDGRSEEH